MARVHLHNNTRDQATTSIKQLSAIFAFTISVAPEEEGGVYGIRTELRNVE